MAQEYEIQSNKHRLTAEGEVERDFVTSFADELIGKITALCDQPFCIGVSEFKCGDEDPHAKWEVASVDEANKDIVVSQIGKDVAHIMGLQYYFARNLENPEENYAGKVTIDLYMFCPEAKDGGEESIENPAASTLLALAFVQYYDSISTWYGNWQTDYIDSPAIVTLGIV